MAQKKKAATAVKKAVKKKEAAPKTFLTAFNKWNRSKFGNKPTPPKKFANPKFDKFADYYDDNTNDALRVIEVDTLDIAKQWSDIAHDVHLFDDISKSTNRDVYNSYTGFHVKQGNQYIVAHEDWEGDDKDIVIRVIK